MNESDENKMIYYANTSGHFESSGETEEGRGFDSFQPGMHLPSSEERTQTPLPLHRKSHKKMFETKFKLKKGMKSFPLPDHFTANSRNQWAFRGDSNVKTLGSELKRNPQKREKQYNFSLKKIQNMKNDHQRFEKLLQNTYNNKFFKQKRMKEHSDMFKAKMKRIERRHYIDEKQKPYSFSQKNENYKKFKTSNTLLLVELKDAPQTKRKGTPYHLINSDAVGSPSKYNRRNPKLDKFADLKFYLELQKQKNLHLLKSIKKTANKILE